VATNERAGRGIGRSHKREQLNAYTNLIRLCSQDPEDPHHCMDTIKARGLRVRGAIDRSDDVVAHRETSGSRVVVTSSTESRSGYGELGRAGVRCDVKIDVTTSRKWAP
jgi:hypothetical protein